MKGPYEILGDQIVYVGNRQSKAHSGVADINLNANGDRHLRIMRESDYWGHILTVDAAIHQAIVRFFDAHGATPADIPLLTRAISSPGAVTHTIATDVKPFKVKYFKRGNVFLSQSSQLYLEALLGLDRFGDGVYAMSKSFRNEKSDFRHLAEFRNFEFESRVQLDEIIAFQEELVVAVLEGIVEACPDALLHFLTEEEVGDLTRFRAPFPRITFREAMDTLSKSTGDKRYNSGKLSVRQLGAWEEVLLGEILGSDTPVFVTHYPIREIAFYHARSPEDPCVALNADCLFPGYGEVIGSGERVLTRADFEEKVKMFRLRKKDYTWYGEIRDEKLGKIPHSGFGIGMERLLCAVLKLPTIVHAIPFPRTHGGFRP